MENILYVVGIGPGDPSYMTAEARRVLQESEVIVGYSLYIELVRDDFPDKDFISTGMTKELERCRAALETAASGRKTAVICSGDAGIYGMASPILTLAAGFPEVRVVIVPGITAASSGAALLGAPLSGDFAVISLSDRLIPWEQIARRLKAAAEADFVIVLYNPGSRGRPEHLRRACDIIMDILPHDTVCGVARNVGRGEEVVELMSLSELREAKADMFTTIFVGNSTTSIINSKMVTQRGY